ncbi:BMC domain-containing protein [Alkaliphilus peptidifermentans]|uniref:BMC domain-containing protein n=1 Tax=Alkaliphilus peptidifermentans DSM 18978 TaxID=1120976 RepID=A0A1G5KUP1_9FIRM|nr:BMC domain-containing protein [Alkaliphilus peptidifermentans]SCZ04383.1 BMC domain-containing protein [Alkaliphilus peptidifermentans DSM 18978]
MSYNALGLLETYGYIPAIVAVDAALKAANVTLKDLQCIGGGLVTMMVEGDVAAVQASIEAGSAAAQAIGHVISQHVIPRPINQLKSLIEGGGNTNQQIEESNSSKLVEAANKAEEVEEVEEVQKNQEEQEIEEIEELVVSKTKDSVIYHNEKGMKITSKKDLNRMKVVDLRKMARGLKGFSMEAKKIKFANKSELVQAILNYLKMEVE